MTTHRFNLILGPLMAAVTYFLSSSLPYEPRLLLSVISLVALWWVRPVTELHLTGMLGVCLVTLAGIGSFADNMKNFANPIIFLFMGGFFLARALEKHELDRWIINKILSHSKIKNNALKTLLAILCLTTVLSMFLSNTATTALMIPIVIKFIKDLPNTENDQTASYLLMLAAASTIGGLGTPIGSPPNAIVLSHIEMKYNIKISFGEWILILLPLVICLFGVMLYYFKDSLKKIKNTHISLSNIHDSKLNSTQIKLLAIILMTIFLWFFSNWHESLVAITMSLLLFLLPAKNHQPLLTWSEAKEIDWGTLLLFGAGLSIGDLVLSTGLAEIASTQLHGLLDSPIIILVMILVTITLFATEFMSNTAMASMMLPLIFIIFPDEKMGIPTSLAVAMASNLAFMLPAGTPPNAIIYATHKVSIEQMIKNGFKLNLAALIFIMISWKFWMMIWAF